MTPTENAKAVLERWTALGTWMGEEKELAAALDAVIKENERLTALPEEPTHAELDAAAQALADHALWPASWEKMKGATRDDFRLRAKAALTAFLAARGK